MKQVVLVAAAAVVLGCGESSTTTLRMWAMGREGEVVAELMPAFEREHPGVRVVVQQLPWSLAHEKLLTAFVGEATPDVAQLGNTWVPEFAALGALEPLDARVAASADVARADYFEGIWATNVVDGATLGIPWYVDTRLPYYRRDLLAAAGFATPPRTWTEWLAAMRAVQARQGAGRYAILLPVDEFEQLLSLALQQPDPLLRDGDRYGNFRSPGFRRALAFYLQIFRERLAPVVIQTQEQDVWGELGRGYIAFMLHGPWSIGEMKRRLPAAQQDTWGTMALPGPDGPGGGIAGGSSLVVFRGAKHPREAWALVEYLSRPAVQRRFREMTGNLPPRRASWDDPTLAGDPYVGAFRTQLERVRRTPAVPEWERIAVHMHVVSERAVRRLTPATTDAELAAIIDETAAALDAHVDALLEKRRWILARKGAP